MTALTEVILSDIVTFILSLAVSLVSFAVKWGTLREEVRQMEVNMAKKEELASVKETLAEIKGMFILKLRE
jgi:cell division protein FtsL